MWEEPDAERSLSPSWHLCGKSVWEAAGTFTLKTVMGQLRPVPRACLVLWLYLITPLSSTGLCVFSLFWKWFRKRQAPHVMLCWSMPSHINHTLILLCINYMSHICVHHAHYTYIRLTFLRFCDSVLCYIMQLNNLLFSLHWINQRCSQPVTRLAFGKC